MKSIQYYIPFEANRVADKEGKPTNALIIKGKAVDTSVNANRWAILSQDLDLVANELGGVPLLTDHEASIYNIVGKVLKGEKINNEVYFEAQVLDEKVINLIENGLVKYVSISVDPEKTVCSTCGKETRDPNGNLIHLCSGAHEVVVKPHPREISLVVFPAYRDTEIKPVGFASAMDMYLKQEESKGTGESQPRSEMSKVCAPENLTEKSISGEGNVGVVESSHAPESLVAAKGDIDMSENKNEKKAQVDTTVPQVNPPAEDKGKPLTYDDVIGILNKYNEEWKKQAEELAKKIAEDAVKRAEEAKKKAEEAEEAKKKAEEAEEAEDAEEAKKVAEEASKKTKVSFGVTNAPAQSDIYPDWFKEIFEAAKKQRAMA